MPLISVIIPAYNCEQYIHLSIQSILSQPLADQCEVIIVNDGSADRTESICLDYAQKHSNVSVISQENRGVSAARNQGIDAAQGDFIMFLDADDTYVDGILGPWLLKVLCENHDVILFSAYTSNQDRNRYGINIRVKNAVFPGGRPISFPGTFATCIYRRDLLIRRHIRFMENIRNNEDQIFNLQALYEAKSIRSCKEFCYIYRKTPNSFSQQYRHTFDFVTAWEQACIWSVQNATQNKAQMLAFCHVKHTARMLLYASNYAQSCRSLKALTAELEHRNILEPLKKIGPHQVMPYQVDDLLLFQRNPGRFLLKAQLTGLKICIGRRLLSLSPVRRWHDKRVYPYTIAGLQGPE